VLHGRLALLMRTSAAIGRACFGTGGHREHATRIKLSADTSVLGKRKRMHYGRVLCLESRIFLLPNKTSNLPLYLLVEFLSRLSIRLFSLRHSNSELAEE
jgi:hypothetical protein